MVKRFSHEAREIFLVLDLLEAEDPAVHEVRCETRRLVHCFLHWVLMVLRVAVVQPLRAAPLALLDCAATL